MYRIFIQNENIFHSFWNFIFYHFAMKFLCRIPNVKLASIFSILISIYSFANNKFRHTNYLQHFETVVWQISNTLHLMMLARMNWKREREGGKSRKSRTNVTTESNDFIPFRVVKLEQETPQWEINTCLNRIWSIHRGTRAQEFHRKTLVSTFHLLIYISIILRFKQMCQEKDTEYGTFTIHEW